MAKKLALGKGIGALIGDMEPNQEVVKGALKRQKEEKVVETNTPFIVDVKSIITNPNQPRKIFKEKELEELSESIKENGVIQPLIVAEADKGYELIAGERRLRASIKAGLEKVPVVIKRATDREKMIMSIIENVQRSDLNCVEEALAYFQLMSDYNLTQDEVAKKLGKERSTVANFLRILKLPRDVVNMIQKDDLSFGHAKILAAVKEKEACVRFALKAVSEKLSVRELEKVIKSKRVEKKDKSNPFFDDKLDQFKSQLEQKTGFHFGMKSKKNGAGEIIIKFSNEADFNDIYEFLLSK